MTSDRLPPTTRSEAASGAPRRIAALGTLVEALVLLGFCAFYVVEMLDGATDDLLRATTSGLLILVFAALLLVLAKGWRTTADWPRTPTLLWNALLLPVAWSLHESGRTLLALAVALIAIVTAGAALAARPAEALVDETAPEDDPER